ncbi:MAG TPA: response regulator, partial [Oculatellaceae cyanobacterium]
VSRLGEGSTFTLYLPQIYEQTGNMGLRSSEIGTDRRLTPTVQPRRSMASLPQAPTPPRRVSRVLPEEQELLPRSGSPSPVEDGHRPSVPTAYSGGSTPAGSSLPNFVADDRADLQPDDRILLIIEDDINFARILLDMARQQGFKALVSLRSDVGLAMAREYNPDAITLDIRMPEMDGWTVLDRLKHDPNTRHIPVHIISVEEGRQRGLQLGAIAYLQKPVSSEMLNDALSSMKTFVERQVKNLLVVEDNETQRHSIVELIGNSDVSTTAVGTGEEALSALRAGHFDCIVLDLGLPDMTGFELIEQIKQDEALSHLPIIIYTGQDLTRAEETELKRIADTIIIKDVRSPERLLDETALFLHRVQANLPQPQQKILEKLHQKDPVLAGKKVLIVDDDVRNIFALTSMLERHQMEIQYAENGRDGLAVLQNTPDFDVVLMDVMMPEMDGYETMRAIRKLSQFAMLPIIALTAKAMKGDREKCIEAGASDYITKPVEPEQLLSLLRVWLYR